MQRTLVENWLKIAFINLLIVATLGCLLRYFFYSPIQGVNYTYVLHAHSHLAFLGWVFMALYALLVYSYLPGETINQSPYRQFFIILQLANMGMLFTFPFTGYALWSIIFSALHAFIAVVFLMKFIQDVKRYTAYSQHISFRFIYWGAILMILSNLAPFALGPVSAIYGKNDIYYLLIYFYLHFQYNGWFTFVVIGLMLRKLEEKGVSTDHLILRMGFKIKLLTILPAYLLSTLWLDASDVLFITSAIIAAIQLIGLCLIAFFIIKKVSFLFIEKNSLSNLMLWVGIVAVLSQHVLMLLSTIPDLATIAFSRNILVAYLHLVLIGFVTLWIFYQLFSRGFIRQNSWSKSGFSIFLAAFTATELFLVFQGKFENSLLWLFVLAVLQFVALVTIFFQFENLQFTQK